MKNHLIITLLLSFIMLFLPFLSLNENISLKASQISSSSPTETETVRIENKTAEKIIETDLFDYIVCCVATEMPASFEAEALKAQAVASYTYKKYLTENGNNTVSSNPEIHQAYKTRDELKAFWGDKYDFYIEKIEDSVRSVFGECLVSNGKAIPALYHALSPGITESAETVFGKSIPSLKRVTAPGDRLSPDFISEKSFTKEDICSLIKAEKAEGGIEITDSTDSNFVNSMLIFGREYDGKEVRSLLGLNSPYFTVNEQNGEFVFTVYGKGHGVGMSQYSADYMARQGSSYKEILMYFYSDCTIEK